MKQRGIIILAGGASTRMKRPKQLLHLQGRTLIENAVAAALSVPADEVVVVLGAFHEKIEPVLEAYPIQIAINPNWQNGMSSTLQVGLATLEKELPCLEEVLVMLCDQPFLTPELLRSFFEKQKNTNAPIVAATYDGTIGVPALFQKSVFVALKNLKAQEGARKILYKHQEIVETVDFPNGKFDVDTPADYERLLRLF